jgi:L-fuconolactonase
MIDTHAHVVSADHARYPLRSYDDDAAWYRQHPCPTQGLWSRMQAAGVRRAVLVQPVSAYGPDNSYVLEESRRERHRWASVASIDVSEANWRTAMTSLVGQGACGVRLGPSQCRRNLKIHDPLFREALSQAGDLGLAVSLQIRRGDLPRVRAIVQRVDNVTVALDHCGHPELTGDSASPIGEELLALAELPTVQLKVSTLVLDEAAMHGGDPRPFVEQAAGAFGAHRLMWGSNYSATNDRSYAVLVALARHAFSGLSPEDRRLAFEETPARLWP